MNICTSFFDIWISLRHQAHLLHNGLKQTTVFTIHFHVLLSLRFKACFQVKIVAVPPKLSCMIVAERVFVRYLIIFNSKPHLGWNGRVSRKPCIFLRKLCYDLVIEQTVKTLCIGPKIRPIIGSKLGISWYHMFSKSFILTLYPSNSWFPLPLNQMEPSHIMWSSCWCTFLSVLVPPGIAVESCSIISWKFPQHKHRLEIHSLPEGIG